MAPFSQRSLLLRANRYFGSALVQAELISREELDAANQRFLEVMQGEDMRQASLLKILVYDTKALSEDALLQHILENESISVIDLGNYGNVPGIVDLAWADACWATWSIPFDRVDNFTFVATTYYLSVPARQHWEATLGTPIVWYATNLRSISEALTRHFIENQEESTPESASTESAAGSESAAAPAPAANS